MDEAGIDDGHPLEAGMVISVKTTMPHAKRGFIRREDTLAITATSYEMSDGRAE